MFEKIIDVAQKLLLPYDGYGCPEFILPVSRKDIEENNTLRVQSKSSYTAD